MTDNQRNGGLNKIEVSFSLTSSPDLSGPELLLCFLNKVANTLTFLLLVSAGLCPFSLNLGRFVTALANKVGGSDIK